MRALRIIIIIGLSVITVQGQDHKALVDSGKTPKYNLQLGGEGFVGFIHIHVPKIGHLVEGHPSGFELFLDKNTNGNRKWESTYNYPDIGYAVGYYDYKSEAAGKSVSLLTYYNFYLNDRKARNHLKLRIAGGFGFHSNPYDKVSNNLNNVIGSGVTFALQTKLIYQIQLANQWSIGVSPTISHFSNAALGVPNKGINVISINLSLLRSLSDPARFDFVEIPESQTSGDRKFRISVAAFGALSEVKPQEGTFPTFIMVGRIGKRLSRKSLIDSGPDIFYSLSLREKIRDDFNFEGEPYPDFKRVGWIIGHEWDISRVSLITQMGFYVYRPYKALPSIYQRYGIRYYFSDHTFGAINLKAHYADAEMAEFGFGYKF